jgi:hypothetical protein
MLFSGAVLKKILVLCLAPFVKIRNQHLCRVGFCLSNFPAGVTAFSSDAGQAYTTNK